MNKFVISINILLIATIVLYGSIDTGFANTISIWFKQNNFTYQKEKNNIDYWKTPEETIRDKGGDCEDFAFLVKYLLLEVDGYSDIKVLAFNPRNYNKNTGHAICVFRESNGNFSYFDNYLYYKTNYKDLKLMLNNTFGDIFDDTFEIFLGGNYKYLFRLER